MTREQIIQNIKTRISTIESYHPEEYALNKGNLFELKDLLSMIEKDEPSLPSNLEEAAITQMEEDGDIDHFVRKGIYEIALKYARLGAEWMAGQFQKIEGELVDWYSTSDGKDYCCGIKTDESFEVPEDFYIKKKQ